MGVYNNSVNAAPGRNINTSPKFAFNRVIYIFLLFMMKNLQKPFKIIKKFQIDTFITNSEFILTNSVC